MKKSTLFFLTAFVFASTSCGGEPTAKETENETEKTETNSDEPAESMISCSDLADDHDNLKGKTVTVTAYSWGNQETIDGKIQIALGDAKLDGMASASVVIDMSDKAAANKIKKDDQITFTGEVGIRDYGVTHIINAVIK